MGTLFLCLSILCSTASNLLSKKSSEISHGSFYSSLIFTFLVSVAQLIIFFTLNGFRINLTIENLLFAGAYGILGILGTFLTLKAFQIGKVSTFMMCNTFGVTLLPFLYGVIFLNEKTSIFKWLGLLLMLVAFVIMQISKKQGGVKCNMPFLIICILCAIFSGFAQIVQKANQVVSPNRDNFSFVIFTQVVIFCILLVVGVVRAKKIKYEININKEIVGKINILVIIAYGIVCGLSLFFSMLATKYLPSVIQFPVLSSLNLLMSTIFASIIYKEKITKKDLFGLALIIIAICFMPL